MAVGLGQQQVVAYRPSLALPSLPLPAESATIIADSNQLPFVHRHWLARIANHAADPHLGNVSTHLCICLISSLLSRSLSVNASFITFIHFYVITLSFWLATHTPVLTHPKDLSTLRCP